MSSLVNHLYQLIGFWKQQVKVAVQYMRKLIQKRAQFDIMDLDSVQVVSSVTSMGDFPHSFFAYF